MQAETEGSLVQLIDLAQQESIASTKDESDIEAPLIQPLLIADLEDVQANVPQQDILNVCSNSFLY